MQIYSLLQFVEELKKAGLSITRQTASIWIRKGKIKAYANRKYGTKGIHYYISSTEINRIKKEIKRGG